MSAQQSSIGIPFPQSNNDRDNSPNDSNFPIDDARYRQIQMNPSSDQLDDGHSSQNFVSAGGQMSPPKSGYGIRNTTQSNASSTSSTSSSTRGGLPSIRNLLNSVSQDEHEKIELPGQSLPSQFSNAGSNSPTAHQRRQTVEGSHKHVGGGNAGHPGREYSHNGPSSQSWDARMSLRSMSPPKRPPIAPSAYAHSQFIVPSSSATNTSQRPTNHMRQPPSSAIGMHAGQHSTGGSWQEGSHSSSSSSSSLTNMRASNTRWPGPPAPLIIHSPASSISSAQAFNPSEEGEQYGSGSLLAKRNLQTQKDLEEPPLSPAAIRRRHTVGAMDEPFSSGGHQTSESREAVSTPRTFQPGRLASPIGHSTLESPTTPTAMNPMAHRLIDPNMPANQSGGHNYNDQYSERGRNYQREIPLPPPRVSSAVAVPQSSRNEGPSAVPHHMYMHHSTQSTGSMPSLSSSVSSASTTSERVRVHSLEGRFDNNQSHPPSAWHNQNVHSGGRTISGSGSFVSPQSSVWHSRSSTLESIETTSSMGSAPSVKANFPTHQQSPHSAKNADFTVREGPPTTPKHHRSDYNRNWRFPNQQQQPPQPQQPTRSPQQHILSNSRTRHESLSRATSGRISQYDEPLTAGYMPPSPFASLSLASPSSRGGGGSSSANAIEGGHLQHQQQQHLRPRAQTMTYTERRIAPLPSHGVHAHTTSASHHSHHPYAYRPSHGGMGYSVGTDLATEHAIPPQRSHSSQSVSSLPHRVSSLEIAAMEGDHLGGGGNMFDFQPLRRRLSSSGGRPTSATSNTGAPSGTVIVSGANVAVNSGAGSAKYECGWCGKRFSRPSSLKIHHHSHTGEKPFVCSEPGCGRTFSVQSNLRRHQKSHAANARKMNVGNADVQAKQMHQSVQGAGGGGTTASGPAAGRFAVSNPINSSGAHMSGGGHIAHMGLSHSLSMPMVGATTGYNGQSGNNAGMVRNAFRSFGADNQEFGSVRERKASVSSSYLGDEYEGEEEFDDLENEEHDSTSNHSHSIRNLTHTGEKRPFSASIKNRSEDTEMMQDIREELPTSSLDDDRPFTAGSVNQRFQGLLNPPSR